MKGGAPPDVDTTYAHRLRGSRMRNVEAILSPAIASVRAELLSYSKGRAYSYRCEFEANFTPCRSHVSGGASGFQYIISEPVLADP